MFSYFDYLFYFISIYWGVIFPMELLFIPKINFLSQSIRMHQTACIVALHLKSIQWGVVGYTYFYNHYRNYWVGIIHWKISQSLRNVAKKLLKCLSQHLSPLFQCCLIWTTFLLSLGVCYCTLTFVTVTLKRGEGGLMWLKEEYSNSVPIFYNDCTVVIRLYSEQKKNNFVIFTEILIMCIQPITVNCSCKTLYL